MSTSADVRDRLRERVLAPTGPVEGDTVVVAVSGGLDSVALLHLLRFTPGLPRLRLVVAHVDHGMRPPSAADADWVRGLARAWGLVFHAARLDPVPTSESAARWARYAFLSEVLERERATRILTAHHADDQAETVLFRALRGTGIRGLAGIPERRGRVWRPLLGLRREQLERYARSVGLGWREDPSNRDMRFARNALRHEVLPALEAGAAPGARRALVGLARRARQEEEAWQSLLPGLLDALGIEREPGRISLSREGLRAHHPGVRARLLRAVARELGSPLKESGTRAALEFTNYCESGRERHLSAALTIRREFDRLVLARPRASEEDRSVLIPGPAAGEGRLVVGGRSFHIRWDTARSVGRWEEAFSVGDVRFPLRVRGWAPGDRVRLACGTKKLKKVFLEARTPASERYRVPVVVDETARVVWAAGVARSCVARPQNGEEALYIGITDAGTD